MKKKKIYLKTFFFETPSNPVKIRGNLEMVLKSLHGFRGKNGQQVLEVISYFVISKFEADSMLNILIDRT